ncbi:hypothetical protein [Ferrimonas gelatinilytica]|uniref:hypothetical protein n=1 Tax=Ferrimonas gelatinilytica TaxID=1255257 RepID=UPI0031EF3DF8
MKKNIVQFLYSFGPMLLSLMLLQLIVLPELYRRDVDLYLKFNYLMYVPLLFVHVLNTACYNVVVISDSGKNKYDVSIFFYIAIVYAFFVFAVGILQDQVDLLIVVFLCSLMLADTAMNLLRIAEKDRTIAKMLLIQTTVFIVLFYSNFDVFIAYALANITSCLYSIRSLFRCNIITVSFSFRGIRKVSVGYLISSAIPTINRYVDKVFVLIALTAQSSSHVLPILSICGLIMLPTSSATKVIIRSVSFHGSINNILPKVISVIPILFLFLYLGTSFGLSFVYGFEAEPLILMAICTLKTISLIELFVFSMLAHRVDLHRGISRVSRYLSLTFFGFIALIWMLGIEFSEMSIWTLPVYLFISVVMFLISTGGKYGSVTKKHC